MVDSLISERVFFEGLRWEFTLNPELFNMMEPVLIAILVDTGAGNVYAITSSVPSRYYIESG